MLGKRKIIKIILLFWIIFPLGLCQNQKHNPYFQLVDDERPFLVIGGGDIHNPKNRLYREILKYDIDGKGNIYIGDPQERNIDKFNRE